MNSRRRQGIALLTTAAGFGLLLFIAWQLADSGPERANPAQVAADVGSQTAPPIGGVEVSAVASQPGKSSVEAPAKEIDIEALIARSSLRGTQPDGEVVLEPNGRLRIDPELRRRLDYYLTLIGELSLDEIGALLRADIARDQGNVVADLVVALFERYVGMRQAMAATSFPDDPLARFERVQALRRQWLGDDADRLFADEIDYDAYTAERLAVRSARDLPLERRDELLEDLAASRPLEEQQQRTATLTPLAVAQQTEAFELQQTDAATRHAERSALWGDDAADRLAALDAQRQHWQQRLDDYAAARQRVLMNTQLTDTAREQALTHLLSGFSAAEQARLRSLAAAGALPDGG